MKQDRIIECADALEALDIEVWDASLDRTWQSLTDKERQFLIANASGRMDPGSRL